MIKNENYIQISGWMVTQLNLSGNELMAYALIHGFSQDGKSVFKGSLTYMQEWLGCSRHTAINAIRALIDKNLIEKRIIRQGNEVLRCEYWTSRSREESKKQQKGSAENAPPPVQNLHNPSAENAPPPVQNLHNPSAENALPLVQNLHPIINSNSNDNAAAVRICAEHVFGKNYFDASFPEKAADFITEQKIADTESYMLFVKAKSDAKKADNPRGFAYKLFFSADIANEFLDGERKYKEARAAMKNRKVVCPVCGEEFIPGYDNACPNCGFSVSNFGDENRIGWHKSYFALSKEMRESYDKEYVSFKSEIPLTARLAYFNTPQGKEEKAKFVAALDKKYGFG